jgi:hypothetical protein
MSFRNVPASVRQRLLDRARSDGRPFSELLQYYAIERSPAEDVDRIRSMVLT